MGKGNTPIDKKNAKKIEDGKIVKELPSMMYNGEMVHLFSVDVEEECPKCNSKMHDNKNHDRYIFTNEGTIEIPVVYKRCKECGKMELTKYVRNAVILSLARLLA